MDHMQPAMDMEQPVVIKSSVVAHINIPTQACGAVIGKGGETIRAMSEQCGADLNFQPEDPMNPGNRMMRMVGSLEQLVFAQQILHAKLGEVIVAGTCFSLPANFLDALPVQVAIQQDKIGRIIGKAGAGFKDFKSRFSVELKVDRVCIIEQGEETRTVTVTGDLANSLLAQAELLKIEAQAFSGGKRRAEFAASGESPYQQSRQQAPQGYGSPYAADPSNPYAQQAYDPANPYGGGYGQQQQQFGQQQGYGQQQYGADQQQQYGQQYGQTSSSTQYGQMPGATPQGQAMAPHEQVSCRFTVPNKQAGIIIGKSGAALTQTRTMSGCQSVKVSNPPAGATDDTKRVVNVDGALSSVQAATLLIVKKCQELQQQAGEPEDEKHPGQVTLELLIPASAAGVIIGKGGASSIEIRKITGAFVRVHREEIFEGERVCALKGRPEQIVAAQAEVLSRASKFLNKMAPDTTDPAIAAMLAAQAAGQ